MQKQINQILDGNRSANGRMVAKTNLLKKAVEMILENESCPERDACILDSLIDPA